MANLITLIRLILVFIISAIALYAKAPWQLLNVPLIFITIALDGLDGIIARARKETSLFGSIFDIAVDRIIEITLWIILAKLYLVSVWIPIIFVARGILVDSLRKQHATLGKAPFNIMQTKIGKFLVASRSMRFSYGLMKSITFTWLLLLVPIPALWPQIWLNHHDILKIISDTLVYITVALCLVRGIPVLLEAITIRN